MKLCTNCLQELFDTDCKCHICNNNVLIDNTEFENLKKNLISANRLKRKILIKDNKNNCVYNYLIEKNGSRYWRDIDCKSVSKNIIYPSFEPIMSIVECPYCHSTNTKKISNISKVFHMALFGMYSIGRNGKNYHCNNCKSDF